ncbi:ACT domain-containing protein [bacterium]|nr:ACT domain-containing protein [bacterium]
MRPETQISVFLKSRVGSLNELCTALSSADINIRSLTTVDDVDWGIVGLIVDDVEKTRGVLRNQGLKFGESNILTTSLENKPGEVARITKTLSDNNISIVHTNLTATGQRSLLVLMTTDNKRACELLS